MALLDKQEAFLLTVVPSMYFLVVLHRLHNTQSSSHTTPPSSQSKCGSLVKETAKRDRKGKGTHGLIVVKKLLEDQKNWQEICTKTNYQFPGVFDQPCL